MNERFVGHIGLKNQVVIICLEKSCYVTLQDILLDLLCNHIGIALQGCVELRSQLGGNLVTYMYKLTEIGVVERILPVVTQCAGILAAVPGCYLLGGGQVCGVDVNDGGVGTAEFLHASQCGDGNLLSLPE